MDIDSKKWRLRADFLNDLAMGIEIFVLPHFQELSTYILCGTSTMKAIVGVAGGATRSALTQHHGMFVLVIFYQYSYIGSSQITGVD